ncbi:hypothetical protein D5086_003594 [Populus alba]|uniref:Uncharacterized protein n=1 Tax=Populus alba TaxID=43335 RepID=A0ACC4D5L4_POPAL
MGKRLVVVREGISTPNTPYLRWPAVVGVFFSSISGGGSGGCKGGAILLGKGTAVAGLAAAACPVGAGFSDESAERGGWKPVWLMVVCGRCWIGCERSGKMETEGGRLLLRSGVWLRLVLRWLLREEDAGAGR